MIFNLGSINADYFYDLPHLPGPGETLAATRMASGLGGKGANQSVAAALAGIEVRHIGCVGTDGAWAVDRLREFGVDVRHVRVGETLTAHAIVMVDEAGENQIVIYPGANMEQDELSIAAALENAVSGDWLMLQNETSLQMEAAKLAREKGLSVAYSAAPFDVQAVEAILPFATLVIMNEVEAQQYLDRYVELMEQLTAAAKKWSAVPQIDEAEGRSLPRVQVSVKLTAFYSQFDPIDVEGSQAKTAERARVLLRRAKELGQQCILIWSSIAIRMLRWRHYRRC